MEILRETFFENYLSQINFDLKAAFDEIQKAALSPNSFTFYTSVAVISSSKIEGEPMEVDSYIKHKIQHIEYLPELTEKPNDLFRAYLFAHENKLTSENFLKAHTIISQHLLPEKWRGVYRRNEMLVLEHNTGNIQFEAAPVQIVDSEMRKLWIDIEQLIKMDLSIKEAFYYASCIHLQFVCIHPFNDANGRAGRLLEKWFLAEKLGDTAWFVQSEKHYYQHVAQYYKNLNRLGIFYDQLDFEKALPFLLMLPGSLTI
ncbi:Fic family protein [Dyadobacter sp. CY343]|uniref:Fic family protein n=1 Tax=Dyadobacter sp. CY343 TaxID=2907299 RepID=UPI001F3B112E|nr:Fic family protein [Dyadobacter sp. CY343]MCE7061215.1 Fic family protein [Dyadobacter sp. CY343]